MSWTTPPLPGRISASLVGPLVGRAPELQVFESVWERVEDGSRQVVFLGGEPGVGKTRLAAEVGATLHQHDVAVLVGLSTQDGGVPYQAFAEVLDHLFLTAPAGTLEGLVSGSDGELTLLSPHVSRHVPAGSSAGGSTDVRRDLFAAVTKLFGELTRIRPVALILEDLQWAQRPTLALLEHLVRECINVPLLVIGTFRTTQPDRSDELASSVVEMHRLEGVRRLDLGGLDTDAIAEYIGRQAGVPAARVMAPAALLRDRTGGNPFFLRELWADLESRGGMSTLRSETPVPASIGDTVERRLEGLGSHARSLLEVAAVLGDEFDIFTLAESTDTDPASVLHAVDAATAVGLIESDSTGSGRFTFVHSLTRQAVSGRLAPSRLVMIHARIGLALESSANDPAYLPRLAHHFLAAHVLGYHQQALRYSAKAGRLAESRLAFEEAAVWFERGAALPELTPEERGSLLFDAAANHLRAGEFARARLLYERLAAMPDPIVRLQAAMGYEDANWRPGLANAKAADLLTAAVSAIQTDESDPRYVQALGSLGRALAFAGETERARAVGSRAIAAAEALGDPKTIMHTLKTSLWHGLGPEVADVQLERASRLCELATAADDPDTLGSAAYFRAMAAYVRGDPVALAAAAADGRSAADRNGQPFFEYVAGCVAQGRALMSGDFPGATRWAEETLRLGSTFGPDTTEGSYGVQMFMINRETGGLDRVGPLLDGRESFDGRWVPGLLAVYTELGKESGVRRALDYLLNRDLWTHVDDAQWPMELAFMTGGALELSDVAALQELEPYLRRYAGMNLVSGQFIAPFGSADRFLARVAAALGRHQEAEDLFISAAAMDRRMGSVIHEAETLAYYALARQQRGDQPGARDLADRATALANRVGQSRILRLLDGVRPERHTVLTDREIEVLRLLASGLSNRDIGEALYISANTAANHVRSILMKTGSANRTQAAMYASEHGLV